MIADAEADKAEAVFSVWDENADTFRMFLKLQTQWRVIEGGFVGLNYQSVEFLVKIHSIPNVVEFMDDLQAMELAALSVLNKRKD